jgi:pyrroline-5-carboxylate reductase
MNKQIAVIGTGQMATALARGLVEAGFCAAPQLVAFDPVSAARERFSDAIAGVTWQASNVLAVRQAHVVLLAVKPNMLETVAEEISSALSKDQLLVSIAAGVSIARLSEWFGTQRLVRVMPNTPCLVGRGVSAYALGPQATPQDAELVERMMSSVGLVLRVDEPYLDCVTGLSGSGPAYVYMLIEALADGGVRVGLPRQSALELAAHTVRGAAEMVVASGEHPAVLKDRVTSPGGTTIAAVQVLEERGFRAAAMAAVVAATQRAREMGA